MGGPDAGQVCLDGLGLDSLDTQRRDPVGQGVECGWKGRIDAIQSTIFGVGLDWSRICLTGFRGQTPPEKPGSFSRQ